MLVVTEREQLPVAEARAGNVEAWESLFRRYRLPLYVYVFELVRDERVRPAVTSTHSQQNHLAETLTSMGDAKPWENWST